MKHPKLPCVAMMIWMALPLGAAVETVSEPFVGSAVTIPGVEGSSERVSFLALRAVRPALYAGRVSSAASTTITDAGANWTAEQFASRAPLYAEFSNGTEADIQQVNVSSKRLTFSGVLPASITGGMAYRIREHHTIGDVFGNANESGLLAGPNSEDAETIRYFIPETQRFRLYFYLNLPGLTGWIADDYSPGSNVVIYPEQGLIIRRKTTGNLTLTSSGPLKQAPSTVPVFPGVNLLGLYNRATPVRLDDLALPAAGFASGPNPDAGDNLRVYNSQGLATTYFYSNLPGYEGWLNFAYQPAGNITLAPGSVFILYRRAQNGALEWTIPAQ